MISFLFPQVQNSVSMSSDYVTTCQRTGVWFPTHACEREPDRRPFLLSAPPFLCFFSFFSCSPVQRWIAASPLSLKMRSCRWRGHTEDALCTRIRSGLSASPSTTRWKGLVTDTSVTFRNKNLFLSAWFSSSLQTRTLAVLMVNGCPSVAVQRCQNASKVHFSNPIFIFY